MAVPASGTDSIKGGIVFAIFNGAFKVIAHLHTLEVAGRWLLKGGHALAHSNWGLLGIDRLLSHFGIN
jgi:hypothetical protein